MDSNINFHHKKSGDFGYVYIGNIPFSYRSSDLRTHFRSYVEKGRFCCFHFRHRPENNRLQTIKKIMCLLPSVKNANGMCCIVKIEQKFIEEFICKYNGGQWNIHSKDKEFITEIQCAYVQRVPLNSPTQETLAVDEIESLIELNPPTLMRNGNVGTPSSYFYKLIKECKMPCNLIQSLGLKFPKCNSKKLYSTVELDYDFYCPSSFKSKISKTCTSFEEENVNESCSSFSFEDTKNEHSVNDTSCLGEVADTDAEDWERHEALHEDVTNQERTKERLFEENLEVKWEKGGSGLVFYTDAYYWHEIKGNDFDEDTVDDWDVDYSVYYDKQEEEDLKCKPTTLSSYLKKNKKYNKKRNEEYVAFERHTRGFGSRILKRYGWKKGEGVGLSVKGTKEPIHVQKRKGDHDHCGLGYYGEKLDRSKRLQIAERDVIISTIYDETNKGQTNVINYKPPVILFVKSTL